MAKTKKSPATIDGAPPMPSDFKDDKEAVRAWHGLIDDLSRQGNLQETDNKLIELAAMTLARVRRLNQELKTTPLFVLNDRGVPIEHPLSKQQATYTTKLTKLLNDLRLTPSTRKAIDLNGDEYVWQTYHEKP